MFKKIMVVAVILALLGVGVWKVFFSGPSISETIDNVNIATKNLENGLTAQAASKSDSIASIIVKGTKANIKDISLENIFLVFSGLFL